MKNMKKLLSLVLTVLMIMSSASMIFAYAETNDSSTFYYVAPNGSDSNAGTEEAPFKTIEKARDTIRELPSLPDGGVTVYLREGEYPLSETFTLAPEDSGEPGKPIVYASYPGEEANIVSKQSITGWDKLTEAEREQDIFGMSDNAKANVYVADIDKGWRFHFLYENGVSQIASRMVDVSNFVGCPYTFGSKNQFSDKGLKANFGGGVLDGLDGWVDAEIRYLTAIWWNVNAVLSNIDSASNTAYLESDITVFYNSDGNPYNIINTPKYLDSAGEWCVDSVNGKVYYWPADGVDPDNKDMFAPKLHELVRFQGDEEDKEWKAQVEYVTLKDLNFYYTDRTPENEFDPEWLTRNGENSDGMIYMQGVSNCTIEDCVLGLSGAQGICVDHYAQNCKFIGNEIGYASSGGIFITGYGPGTTDLNKNHLIQRNHIHHIGLEYMHSCAVQIYGSNNNLIEYNYMHDLPYAAVSIIGMRWDQMKDPSKIDTWNTYGGQATMYNQRSDEIDESAVNNWYDATEYHNSENNTVQYNICDDYMGTLQDGGALYAWCSGVNKLWQYNVGTREATDHKRLLSIHMDDYDGYNTVYKNLFYATNATDNSHTNADHNKYVSTLNTYDSGDTYLDVWDSTKTSNIWKENIIRHDEYPDGYLAQRAFINATAGEYLNELPVALKISVPKKTQYETTDIELDLTGLQVVAVYADPEDAGTFDRVVKDYSVSGFTPGELGKQKITVYYGGKSACFDINVVGPEIVASLESGTHIGTQTVTLSANYANAATLYYTTDGSTPTESSEKYENAITIDKDTVLTVAAIDSQGTVLDLAVYNYVIKSGLTELIPDNSMLHLDASDTDSLTVDANGYVSQWNTTDGKYSVSQSTAANRPKLVKYNGYNALNFDGSDGLINTEFTNLKNALSGTKGVTVIAVSRCTNSDLKIGSADIHNVLYVQQGASWGKFALSSLQGYAGFIFAPGQSSFTTYVRSENESGLTATMGIKNGTTESLYVDGTLVNTATGRLSATVAVSDDLYIGTNAASQGFVGDIAEIMIFDRALSADEIAAVNAYIKLKYFNVSAPVMNEEFDILADTHKVILSTETEGADIYYTTDGSVPTASSIKYTAPIEITDTITLKTIAVKDGWYNSDITEKNIFKHNVIADAALHLDASDAASLTVDANGYVSQWKTKDGSYAVSQATSEKQPKLVEYDGYKALYFDGTDGLTNLTATALQKALGNKTAVTAIAVSRCAQSTFAKPFGGGDVYGILYVQQVGDWGKFTLNAHQGNAGFTFAPGKTPTDKYTAYARNEIGLTSTMGVKNGTTESLYVDGTLVKTSTRCSEKTINVSDDLYIGTNAANQGFVGDIAEVMVFDRALSDAEIAAVNAYIKQKYFNVSESVMNEEFDVLTGEHKVTLSTNTIGADIYYTTDGSEPDGSTAIKYTAPIEITESIVLKAIAVKNGWNSSDKIEKNICKHNVTTTAKAPTCTETGFTEGKYCSVCSEIFIASEEIAALGHTEIDVPAKESTCTETGLTAGKKCTVCGEFTVAQEVIEALGHKEETIPGQTETCYVPGSTEGKKCSVCGEILVAPEVIPAHHTPKEAVSENIVNATCTAAGSYDEVVYCEICNEELNRTHKDVEKLAHTEEIIPAVDATCTEIGLTEGKKCSVCGETLVAQEEIAALGHTEEVVPGKDATCTEKGLTEGKKCTVCGVTTVEQEEIAALGHTEEVVPGKAATCTEKGLTEGKKCTVCGVITVEQEEIAALGHTEEVVPGKAATCTEKGLTDGKKCTVCGVTTVAQEEIAALGHTEEVVPGKAATCTEKGLTEGKKCTVCGEITIEQEVIEALGHTEATVPAIPATCTEAGLTDGKLCAVCGETLVAPEVVEALGHSDENADDICDACGFVLKVEEEDKSVVETIRDNISSVVEKATETATKAVEKAVESARETADRVSEAASAAIRNITETFENIRANIVGFIDGTREKIEEFFSR